MSDQFFKVIKALDKAGVTPHDLMCFICPEMFEISLMLHRKEYSLKKLKRLAKKRDTYDELQARVELLKRRK